MEKGSEQLSVARVFQMAQTYHVPSDSLFGALGVPQFAFAALLAAEPRAPADEIWKSASDEEKRELTAYLTFLRLRRRIGARTS